MVPLTSIVLAAWLLACLGGLFADDLRPDSASRAMAAATEVRPLPPVFLTVGQKISGDKAALRPESRLQIVRYVSGEFVKVVKPLPAAKNGFRIQARAPLDEKELQQALANQGAAVAQGDTAQITHIEFRDKEIAVELNGGSKKHKRLRDHIQIGIGGAPAPRPTTVTSTPGTQRPPGATLVLDYGRLVPDMSPDDLKHDLSGFLDFSKERSAAVQWVDTLPPEYRQAIKDRRALVGMDHDMVIAAMGRPDQKVRERDEKGDETEDWIYGTPPAKTVFVTFASDKVVRVKQYP